MTSPSLITRAHRVCATTLLAAICIAGHAEAPLPEASGRARDATDAQLIMIPGYESSGARFGVGSLRLADGRLLVVGGDSIWGQRANVLDPDTGAVQPLPPAPHGRNYPIMLALPDGRVLVAGHGSIMDCDQAAAEHVDLLDLHAGRWSSLPALPFPLCAAAYHAEGPSGAVLADGTVVLGGHLEKHVQVLRPLAESTTGYTTQWEVVGQLVDDHWGGSVQAVGPQEVAVAGGVLKRRGGCCYPSTAREYIAIPPAGAPSAPYASQLLGAAGWIGIGSAQRSDQVLLAGGRAFRMTSGGQMRYSRLVELLDLRTGQVQQLPSLPFSSAATQVVWLDAQRVLVKGVLPQDHRSALLGDNLFSAVSPGSGAVAVFDLAQHRWTQFIDGPELARASLLHAEGNEALLLSDGALWRLDMSTRRLTALAPTLGAHGQSAARRLSDGRVVLAGGWMEHEFITLMREPDAQAGASAPESPAPEPLVAWGPVTPSRHSLVWTPSSATASGADVGSTQSDQAPAPPFSGYTKPDWREAKDSPRPKPVAAETARLDAAMAQWRIGPNSQADASLAVIDATGRVTRGLRARPANAGDAVRPPWSLPDAALGAFEFSATPEGAWTPMPWPVDPTPDSPPPCQRGCHLMLGEDPHVPGKEWVFLREGWLQAERFWEEYLGDSPSKNAAEQARAPLRVWWFDEQARQWQLVLRATADDLRAKPLPLGGPFANAPQPVMSLGWHLERPLLWRGQ